MSDSGFELEQNERVLRQEAHVRRGFWGMFTGKLVLTDRALVYVDYGALGNYKGYTRLELAEVSQAVVGRSRSGKPQLEVYHDGVGEEFAFKSGGRLRLESWSRAINKSLPRDGGITTGGIAARAAEMVSSLRSRP